MSGDCLFLPFFFLFFFFSFGCCLIDTIPTGDWAEFLRFVVFVIILRLTTGLPFNRKTPMMKSSGKYDTFLTKDVYAFP